MRDLLLPSVGKIILFWPGLAHAHGDDNVTAVSFIGPLVAFFVFVIVVGLGRVILRMMVRRI